LKNIYIFDVDGTLTPSRKMMVDEFADWFKNWSSKNKFYLVSGSDLKKMKEQVPQEILERAEGLFTCGGNEYYTEWMGKQVYSNEFKPPTELIEFLEEKLLKSPYGTRAGNHIDNRGSMINFSIVGRDCSDEQRQDYFEYDLESKEREQIAQEINYWRTDLSAVIGGQISIDIAPKGNDKSQILYHIMKEQPNNKYFFIGDRTMEGGNDYPLAKVMNETDNCWVFQVGEPSDKNGYKETYKILKYDIHEGYPDFSKSPHLESTDEFTVKIESILYLKDKLAETPIDYDNLGPIPKKRFERKTEINEYGDDEWSNPKPDSYYDND